MPNQDQTDPRHKLRQERLARIAVTQRKRVRVVPRDDDMRRVLKHPSGIAFRSEGSIEWPFDQFTKRRLRDGTVTLEAQPEADKRERGRALPRSKMPAA